MEALPACRQGQLRWGFILLLLVVCSVEEALSQSDSSVPPPDIELAVYGSGSFKEGLAVGDSLYVEEKDTPRLLVSGGQSEVAFHDRSEVSCASDKRWNLYASEKTLRTHRPGSKGGFVVSEDMTRFLQDLNVGGVIATKTLTLSGAGDRPSDAVDGEPLLIGNKRVHHLKMGYNTGHNWIQSVKTHLAINSAKNRIVIGSTQAQQQHLTVNSILRVDDKLTFGGSDSKAYISETHLQLEHGGGWYMDDTAYLKSLNNLPVYTKGGGKFMGNVGIGTLPKFPIFRLQVHQSTMSDHGTVMVTDKADRGITLSQTKEGALLRSWNIDTRKHEAMLVEAGPLLIQPRSGMVLFGTTVRKKGMQLHAKGNVYIHGHMFAMKNMHIRDHANMKHLLMPSISLKNKPQSPDGDTLVLGHVTKGKVENTQAGPWEAPSGGNIVRGVNLRLGYHNDYTWVQVHGKRHGSHMPIALNPLGNTVAIGTINPDKRYKMHANGNGYVLGTLFVKMEGTGHAAKSHDDARITDYSQLSTEFSEEDAMQALQESRVQKSLLAETTDMQDEMLRSRLALISVPEKLATTKSSTNEISINRMTSMIHKVLRTQERHMAAQDAALERQNAKIAQLQSLTKQR